MVKVISVPSAERAHELASHGMISPVESFHTSVSNRKVLWSWPWRRAPIGVG